MYNQDSRVACTIFYMYLYLFIYIHCILYRWCWRQMDVIIYYYTYCRGRKKDTLNFGVIQRLLYQIMLTHICTSSSMRDVSTYVYQSVAVQICQHRRPSTTRQHWPSNQRRPTTCNYNNGNNKSNIFCLEQETPRKWLCAAKLGEICLDYFLSSGPFMVPKSTKGLSLILYTPRSRHVKLCSRSGVLAVDTVDDASGQWWSGWQWRICSTRMAKVLYLIPPTIQLADGFLKYSSLQQGIARILRTCHSKRYRISEWNMQESLCLTAVAGICAPCRIRTTQVTMKWHILPFIVLLI